jgi:deoxyribodipyrimidine photo-lyase
LPDSHEATAQQLLSTFTAQRINDYGDGRNLLAQTGTSMLSPYLRFGIISPQECARAAITAQRLAPPTAARSGAEVWLSELAWRDFYQQILYHFPHVANYAFRPMYDDLAWDNNPDYFAAWCQGMTGYPIVDAAMRQLSSTGWMHNRARMIVASFLTKDLLIDWRWGERYFMQQLIDGDTAANNGGWQWSAGTGTDAQPYFRIFNPISQGETFDPDGTYVKRYIPELANIPTKYIHAPWLMPPMLMHEVRCLIGHDYPAPIVDHATQRVKALAMYKLVRPE